MGTVNILEAMRKKQNQKNSICRSHLVMVLLKIHPQMKNKNKSKISLCFLKIYWGSNY